MTANQAQHSITLMAKILAVSVSGFYAFKNRQPSEHQRRDEELTERIVMIHTQSRGTDGTPLIFEELKEEGVAIGKKRVARLMKQRGLKGVHRWKWPVTTKWAKRQRPAPDLVRRDFTANAPNELWVADITYVPTTAGFLYLSVVLDVFSRRVVGWSMGSVGDCYDNALCESFFATLECELIARSHFSSLQQARLVIFDFIEGLTNPRRRHSAIGYLSPINFERQHLLESNLPKAIPLH